MDNIEMKSQSQLTNEELEKASGGIGMVPPLPGSRRHRWIDPNLIKDEPRDGGATGGW